MVITMLRELGISDAPSASQVEKTEISKIAKTLITEVSNGIDRDVRPF